MKRTQRRLNQSADILYHVTVSRWAARYGLGSPSPEADGLDEFMTIELSGAVGQPAAVEGSFTTVSLRHEGFLDSIADMDDGPNPIGHIIVADDGMRAEILVPYRTLSALLGLASSRELRSIILRGTRVRDRKALIFQIELNTQLPVGEVTIEER